MAKAKVTIPTNVQELLELADFIQAKHSEDGESSVLSAMPDNTIADMQTKADTCLKHHLHAEELRRQMELAYRERDLLLGVHRKNPKKLGDWGFVVSDRAVAKTTRTEPLATVS
ncbi:hypothetical protein [Jiulongibacter sediminis]|uniref:Uncharacterized protein n=1 Tax=Jiulongibacter sediminis TaxID=1605367 RepID=A0A0P7BYR8_9BACT|nr:hypothetical protein [Jiulongibacter sediminis]KPM49651.1 hypothetical protein AFM12_03395 [Jiulongibacter sediminis]TBX26689.1 hypothetical protein TK44_03400 [Jiulongibacter sediminis]